MVEHQTRLEMIDSVDFFEQAIEKLRENVWVGVLLFTLVAMITTRLMRYNAGVQSTLIALAIQIAIYSVIFASLLLRKSRYARLMQTIFIVLIHLVVPVVLVLYGGIQGFGDVALFNAAIVSILFGWQRWMYGTIGFSVVTLFYVYYREFSGQPLTPFLEDAQFANLKMLIFISFVGFTVYFGNRFYRQLLERHRLFAEEQLRLTSELQSSDSELRQLTGELIDSRQQIVTAQEEERLRLRRDLHDDLGPTLAALVYQAGAARNLLPEQPDEADEVLTNLELGIENTLSDVRRFVYALRPPLLDQLGLFGAIREYVKKIDAPFPIELEIPERLKLGAATEVAYFNIIQAALEQVVHSETIQHCILSLTEEDDIVTLSIKHNDSQAFVTPAQDATLTTIREWAEELTGTVELILQQPHGNSLRVHLPNTRNVG